MRDRAGARGRGGSVPTKGRASGSAQRPQSEARAIAEARKNQREERQRRQRRAGRLRLAGIFAAVLLVLAGCIALYTSNLFAITRIEVVGNSHVSTARVRALAAVPAGSTLIRFPAAAVAGRIEADPWVASVSVSRVFPNGMRIRVTERTPIALVQAGPNLWLADGTGMIIARPTTETSATLPVVRDVPGLDPKAGRPTSSEALLNALKVLAGIDHSLAASVRTVSAPSVDETTLVRDDHVEIVIGQAVDLATKSQLAERILSDQRGKVVSIDVRVIDRPTWRGLK